jgi:opacity protein-like surface antigen
LRKNLFRHLDFSLFTQYLSQFAVTNELTPHNFLERTMKKLYLLVVVVVLCSAVGFAQGLGLKGVGGSVGYTSVSANGGSSTESLGGFALSAHADLGEITPGFQLVPELQYWSVSKDINSYSWKFSDFAINANVRYNIQMEGGIKPYAGAGLGLNFWSSTIDMPAISYGGYSIANSGSLSSSGSRLGINIMAGANYAMGSMTIVPEVRYVLASDINHFVFKVGVMVPLGK